MKHVLFTLIVLVISALSPVANAASEKEYVPASRTALLDRCREFGSEFKTVYIGKTMMGMVKGKHLNVGDYAFEKIIGKIEDLSVITAEGKKKMDTLNWYSTISGGFSKKDNYKVILEIYDEGEHLTIYERKLPNKLNEFALKIEKENSLTIIQITGTMTEQDLQRIKRK